MKGIYSALLVSFDKDGNINEKGLREIIRHNIDVCKIDGLYVGGSTGENFMLSTDEKKRIFEIAMDGPDLVVAKHDTSFENLDNDIKAAYVVIKLANGKEVTTVMTKKQIDKSWSKAKTKNVQNDFPEEMAKRTVINRAAKYLINTSNDNDLFVQAAKDTLENEFERKDVTPEREEQAAVLEEKLFSNNKKAVDQENDNERITRVADVPEQPDIEQAKPIEKEDLMKTAEQILEEPVQETLDVMAGYETNQKESEPDVSTIEEDDYPF